MKYIQVRIVIIVDYSSAYVHLEYSRDGWIVNCEPAVGICHLVKTRMDWTAEGREVRSWIPRARSSELKRTHKFCSSRSKWRFVNQ